MSNNVTNSNRSKNITIILENNYMIKATQNEYRLVSKALQNKSIYQVSHDYQSTENLITNIT